VALTFHQQQTSQHQEALILSKILPTHVQVLPALELVREKEKGNGGLTSTRHGCMHMFRLGKPYLLFSVACQTFM
jgi:hypothetical protein